MPKQLCGWCYIDHLVVVVVIITLDFDTEIVKKSSRKPVKFILGEDKQFGKARNIYSSRPAAEGSFST
ncbi:hypothetical protein O6P43_021018 [Quillaja saponaria]|uniref:Uncharacterized protein n=1 Tax=Quillaja saponaria TaxID=32244 RepID=A0AAD7PM24_QUISA|nr:hypothetical protein O6P43_021018 [Quillaja saponaria]